MNGMSDEEFQRIYGRPPRRKKKKVKIYWNRIFIALVILVGIIIGFVKLVTFAVDKISGGEKAAPIAASAAEGKKKSDADKNSSEQEKEQKISYSDVELIVCVDPGHGDHDGGTTSKDGQRFEKDDNLAIALKVQEYLEKCGVTVVMTRTDDTFVELGDRCQIANDAKADLMLCLHRNSYGGNISGVEAWVHNSRPAADTLMAEKILEKLEQVGVSANRGVQYGYVGNEDINYYINNDTVMPSCLVEMGFLTDDNDNWLFDENIDEYSVALGDAVIESAIELGIIDGSGKRLTQGQYLSQEKPINNNDSSSAADAWAEMTEPSVTDDEVYNTQENEYAR